MKKYIAVLLIAIMAVSVLSAAGVVAAANSQSTPAEKLPAGLPAAASPDNLSDQNPPMNILPIWGTTVQVKLVVSPLPLVITVPQTNQLIRVTILYNKNGFDPLAYNLETFRFGRTGTEASPITQYVSDVNGYKDLTLVFRAQDTGLRPGDFSAKLTGVIRPTGCWDSTPVHCDIVPPPWYHLTVTGTVPIVVL